MFSASPIEHPLIGVPQSAKTARQVDMPQSHNLAVPSLELEMIFLPRSTIAVSRIPM